MESQIHQDTSDVPLFTLPSVPSPPSSAPTNTKPPVRLYCYGAFDLFHYGHARLFERCKSEFGENTVLIVGVVSDEDLCDVRPVMTAAERAETLRHCRWVDEVVCPCPEVPTMVSI